MKKSILMFEKSILKFEKSILKFEVGFERVNGWRRDEEIHQGENWRLGDTAQKSTYSVSGISEIFTETHSVSGIK